MTTEHLVCAVELHADEERRGPGRLRGVLLRFGETTRDSRRQSFAAGSLKWDDGGVVLNEQHNRQAPITRVRPTVDGDTVKLDVPLRCGHDARPGCRGHGPQRHVDRLERRSCGVCGSRDQRPA